MVFESVVTDLLNKILGDYVENLDKNQLKIGIWGGDVVLHNLKLRENALDDLDLPVQLVYGYLGKLVLKIPWKNLYSQPVVAQIEDLYLLINPKQSVKYDAEKEEKYQLQTKQSALEKLDEAHKLEMGQDKPKPDATFTEKLTAQIINNLQVKIANVHLRYEDVTTTGKPFAFGITLHNLEIYTTDINWQKCYLTEQVSRVYKIASLDSLSAYMNCIGELYTDSNKQNLEKLFRENIASKDNIPSMYCYVLGPISSIAKLQLNMNPEYDTPAFVIPKIDLCLEMEKLNIGLTSTQFQDILKLADSMNRMQLGAPYRKYRPFNLPYKNNYKEWWKFAIEAVLDEIRKRNIGWSWEHMKDHRQLCETYAEKFKERELAKKPEMLLIETCNLLETRLDLFNLILIRKRVQLELDKIRKEEEEHKLTKRGTWFGGWFSGGKKDEDQSTTNDIVKKFEAAMTSEEKQKLFSAIGYEENSIPLNIPETYIAINMNFKLIALEVGLYDDSKERARGATTSFDWSLLETLMLLKFSMATATVRQRPGGNAISVSAGMKEMKLTGLERTDYIPTIIESKITDEFNLLEFFFETNPLDQLCDQRIKLHARPLQIVYDSDTILKLLKVFTPEQSVNLSELEGAATERISNFKERSATGMQYVIDNKAIIEVDVKFMPNILILPSTGAYVAGEKSLIVVTLGQLHIVSQPLRVKNSNAAAMTQTGKTTHAILDAVSQKAYDRYRISIDDMQVLVTKPHENWEEVLVQATKSDMHVLRPTSIIIEANLCVLDDDPRLPKTKINIELPYIYLNITEDRMFEALGIVNSLPRPENAPTEPSPLVRALSSASSKLSLASFLNQDGKKNKKTKTGPESGLTTEIVQYTSLEVAFALKEFHVTLCKSCTTEDKCITAIVESPTDTTYYSTPEEEIPSAIDEFQDSSSNQVVTATVVVPPQEQKIVTLQILQLEAYMAQRTYEMVATAKLGAIQLLQYDNWDNKETELSVIDTPRFSEELRYLLTVSYTQANKTSPEFISKYNSTEQYILVKFSTLNLTLHQECLLRLMEIANALQQKLEAASPQVKGTQDRIGDANQEGIIDKLATIMEEHSEDEEEEAVAAAVAPVSRKSRTSKVVDSIKIHLVANLEQVGVLLTCRKRPLATMKVQFLDASVILKTSYTELNLRLKNIILNDLNPATVHKNILSIVGNNALNCQVVMYNLDETANYNSDDMKITVEIGCIKIVFLNWFVAGMLSFLNNFQAAQEAVANASAAAADAAKQKSLEAYQKATRMKLNIKVKAPIIVVPIDSQSLNAIAIDLGFLMLSNTATEIQVPKEARSPAVIDEIKLELKNMKVSKVAILQDHEMNSTEDEINVSYSESFDTTDTTYGIKSDVNIMNPMSFTLAVKRNLSSSWYHQVPEIDLSGRLKSIELNLFMEDYALIMSILNCNLNEGFSEFPPTEEVVNKPIIASADIQNRKPVTDSPSRRIAPSTIAIAPKPDKAKVLEQLKFNFQFDGVVVNLMLGENEGLARFGLHILSLKGTKLMNGTLSTSVVLCNIQIDDTRSNSTSKIKKYLCRKDWKTRGIENNPNNLKICETERNYMLDVTAIIKENDIFAEVRVCGFDLILCIDFLLKLSDFVTIPQDQMCTDPEKAKIDVKAAEAVVVKQQQIEAAVKRSPSKKQVEPEKKMTLLLHIEEPDIILIESLEDINTNAIIFNMQAQVNYRAIGEKQIINGQINGMKMFMCSFMPERREATKHYIIHPCMISLQGSTPEEEGLHISLKLSEIIINVSPATIELFNKAMLTINASSAEKEAVLKKEANYSNIWSAQKFIDKDHWFVKVDKAQDVLEVLDSLEAVKVHNRTEKCVIEVPSITLIIETGVGYYTTPLISIDTQLNAVASDWSRNMTVKGSLSLNMNYFNQTHAVWEPIIEMNERQLANGEREYLPWELNFAMAIETKKSEFEEDVEEKTTTIKIHSDENLELTVSKTCLDLLGVLGEAFSQAIDSKGLIKPEVVAPYVVENDTGFDISINFRHGIFTLHECHMPQATSANTLNHSLVFQAEDKGANFTPEQIQDCTISPGGRAFLQTKNFETLQEEEGEEIYVKVGGIDKEVVLPLSKSDTRYFPLYHGINQDPWGIVSEVRSEFGTTKINIHGVLNIYNHFTTSIQIYRINALSEKLLVGEVQPGQMFHVPLHAIYANNKELYFTLDGYHVSVQGIKWNDSPTDLTYTRQLQCDPIKTFETFYMNVLRTKTEVYHENTNKFMLLSAFYTLHIKPPLYLRNYLPVSITVSVAGCSVRQDESANERDSDDLPKRPTGKEELLDYGEKEVCPGDVLHLPTFKLSGKSKENRSYLVVRLLQYLEKDWSCTTEVSAEHIDMGIWKFSSYDSSATMDMDLFVRMEDRRGSLMITLYSPFWMINKTGLMLSYKTDTETVDVLYHPPEYAGPILFSFREKFFFDKKAAKIRVDNGDWSDKIPLDVAGSIGEVVCKTVDDLPYRIGVHNHLTHNSLTKQITFIPFYVASNKCSFPLELQEQSRPGDPWSLVKPDMCVPLWPQNDADLMIVAKADGHCTVPFNYSEAQCILLKLEKYKYGGINVDVQATEGGIYITFTEYNPGDAPGLLMNHTHAPISYLEKGSDKMCVLSPHEKILYTWDDPNGDRTLIFGKERLQSDLRRDDVGEMKLGDGSKGYWVSFLDGLQRVLLFTDIAEIATKTETSAALQTISQSFELRIHGIGLSVLNNETGVDILYLGITSSGVNWEVKKPGKKHFKQMKIHETDMIEAQYQRYLAETSAKQVGNYHLDGRYEIDFDRMILAKTGERSIQRTFYPGVWISMNTSPFQSQIHAKINKIQIDNQLNDCIFPVVLAPIAPPKSVAATTELKPFVECSIVQRVVPNSTVKQYKYATMLIQEFHFKVDILFLTAIAENFAGTNTDAEAAKKFSENVEDIEKPLSELVATHSKLEQKNFYDNLHLGPLKIHVSFSMAGSDTTALPGILSTLVQGVGVTLTDVNDVVFRLAYFEREYQFFTQRQLSSEITTHYTGQALKQLYVLVLGLDVLGNPYGLVVGLKKGVQDLFYEPFQGAIQGPGEFAEGLVLGVKSLFGHTVGGAAGAVSKITGAMGKGLAALTFDDDYQKKRRENLNRKPTNFQEGIARSSKSLVMGFVDGVTGVVTKPVAGAREEGVEGFFKGLGKGAIGFVARPTAGVVDFASGSFAAVKRATENSEEANRLRPPRFIHQDCVMRPYCRTEAEGNKIFKEIEKGKYASTDTFVRCEEIVRKHEFVLVSNYRVIYINKNDLFGTWNVQWTYLWHEIASIKSTDRGVEIVLKKEGKKIMGLFSSHEEQRKVILVPQKSLRDELTEIMESQRKET